MKIEFTLRIRRERDIEQDGDEDPGDVVSASSTTALTTDLAPEQYGDFDASGIVRGARIGFTP